MNRLTRTILAGVTVVMLASCEHKVAMLTEVHPDGSLDKTIVLETKDPHNNILGIDPENGWETKVEVLNAGSTESGQAGDSNEYSVRLRKHFASAADANAELAVPNDTLFRVTSTFEKKFRWFYTYLYYADTYHTLNRLRHPIDDYLTREDYAFMDRLPAEGKPMASADSVYLNGLNDKIIELYGARAFFEVYYSTAQELLRKNQVAPAWIDTLDAHKRTLFERVRGNKSLDEDFMVETMDSLGIPLPADADSQFTAMIKPAERIMNFISMASDGKYQHAINMPWDISSTNADSVAGRSLFWSPPSIKFLVKDYTMYAEARRMNYWAVALSAALIGFTGYLLWRRR
jgi:hypothetical protein